MVIILVRLLVNAVALAAAVWLVGGVTLTGDDTTSKAITLIIVAAIFGIINAVIKPIIKLVTLPALILTLGLLIFVINALMLWLTSAIAGAFDVPFTVEGFWAALLGSLVVSVVSWLLNLVLPD